MTLRYKDASIVFDMPGWYCVQSEESIHTGEDMQVSDQAPQTLKETRNG